MNASQLREHIIRPVLKLLDKRTRIKHSQSAEDLLMLTACVESQCGHYIHQINGPAVGIFQMEPTTEQDIWNNYLIFLDQEPIWDVMKDLKKGKGVGVSPLLDPFYATAMARVHYYRDPAPLPVLTDETEDGVDAYVTELALYWKRVYNTHLGKGDTQNAVMSTVYYSDFDEELYA